MKLSPPVLVIGGGVLLMLLSGKRAAARPVRKSLPPRVPVAGNGIGVGGPLDRMNNALSQATASAQKANDTYQKGAALYNAVSGAFASSGGAGE